MRAFSARLPLSASHSVVEVELLSSRVTRGPRRAPLPRPQALPAPAGGGGRPGGPLAGARMVCIRQATVDDLLAMKRANLMCLPENYQLK